MKKILVAIFAIGIMVPATAKAENWYVTADAGLAFLNDADTTVQLMGSFDTEYKTGYLLDAGLGYDFGSVRTEAVFHYQRNDGDLTEGLSTIEGLNIDGDTSGAGVMVNGYYDFNTGYAFQPFITAGLGWAQVKTNVYKRLGVRMMDDSDNVFAWQAGVGIAFAVSDTAFVDFTYHYFATSDPTFESANFGSIDTEIKGNNFSLGIRNNF